MDNDTTQTDEALDQNIARLQKCQKEHKVDTCSDCELYIPCEVRKEYVKAVYSSMNKDKSGGFEF